MSVLDEDPEALFNGIVAGLDIEEPEDAINFRNMDDVELANYVAGLRLRLHELNAMYERNPKGEAAVLHSEFAAANVEMHRRWSEEED